VLSHQTSAATAISIKAKEGTRAMLPHYMVTFWIFTPDTAPLERESSVSAVRLRILLRNNIRQYVSHQVRYEPRGLRHESRIFFFPQPRNSPYWATDSFLITKASRSHSDTPQSVGLLWTSDQPVANTSTSQ
jgi:hypothetical protein